MKKNICFAVALQLLAISIHSQKTYKYGFIDKGGNVRVPIEFRNVHSYVDGFAVVDDGKSAYIINEKGEKVRDCFENERIISKDFTIFSITRAPIEEGGIAKHLYGIADINGNIKVEPRFLWLSEPCEGLAYARDGGVEGMIDETGRWAFILPKRDIIVGGADFLFFSEGLAAMLFSEEELDNSEYYDLKSKEGYINKKGETVIKPKFTSAYNFNEGIACVFVDEIVRHHGFAEKIGGRGGYINKKGRYIVSPKFKRCTGFSEGLAAVAEKPSLWGYINKKGKLVIPYQFSDASPFNEGLAVISIPETEDLLGFIDRSGKIVIPPRFKKALDFSEGLAAVESENGKWGYIDQTGKFVIEPQFDEAYSFQNGFAVVASGEFPLH